MKPYGLQKKDRLTCIVKGCSCGDFSSKHPLEKTGNHYNMNKRLKKHARRVGSNICMTEQLVKS